MLALFFSLLVSFVLCAGFGLLVSSTLLNKQAAGVSLFFVGLVSVNTLSSFLSIVVAINGWVTMVMLIIALICLYVFRYQWRLLNLANTPLQVIWWCIGFSFLGFYLASNEPLCYDSALYHIQSIKWIEEYKAVPGLANLHSRFGYNSNIFSFYALTSLNEFFQQDIYSVNLLVFILMIFYFIPRLYTLYTNDGLWFIFYFILFIVTIRFIDISSPSSDYLVQCLSVYVFLNYLDFYSTRQQTKYSDTLFILFLVSVYLVTVKLSAIIVPLLFLPLIANPLYFIRIKSKFLLMAFVIILPWLIRNVVLSGWLVFPFASIDLFDVDWKVPESLVVREQKLIIGLGRQLTDGFLKRADLPWQEWVPIWWQDLLLHHRVGIVLGLLSPLVYFILLGSKKIVHKFYFTWIHIVLLLGIVYWFFTAPNWRFGEVYILLNAFLWLLSIFYWKPLWLPSRSYLGVLCLMAFMYFGFRYFSDFQTISQRLASGQGWVCPPNYADEPGLYYMKYYIRHGWVYLPSQHMRCDDHALPCAPYPPDASLEMRGSSIAQGYRRIAIPEMHTHFPKQLLYRDILSLYNQYK